jgi:hypothetical protein
MHDADTATPTEPAASPDPHQDRDSRPVPRQIAEIHGVLQILSGYGHHLYATLQARSLGAGFAFIAQFFGTAAVTTILAQVYRGMMRCDALDRLLRARAARGRDLRAIAPRQPSIAAAAARLHGPAGVRVTGVPHRAGERAPGVPHGGSGRLPHAAPSACDTAPGPHDTAHPHPHPHRAGAPPLPPASRRVPLSFDTLPSMAQIEAEVGRSPIGRTLVLICQDFGISPGLCDDPFWHRLFDAVRRYGSSVDQIVLPIERRKQAFEHTEIDRNPQLEWPEPTSEGIRTVLGFAIGQPPVMPPNRAPSPTSRVAMALAVAAAKAAAPAGAARAATGPPQPGGS